MNGFGSFLHTAQKVADAVVEVSAVILVIATLWQLETQKGER